LWGIGLYDYGSLHDVLSTEWRHRTASGIILVQCEVWEPVVNGMNPSLSLKAIESGAPSTSSGKKCML
jgi:hypothetical protein